ncbi:hypothetical protein Adeh_3270 [Anaeromyxobacter dehalogenans 2CP-C]|uniref:Uncharacterized protein n=1 Tax=Anaeromyxobacter dehalogenans (strain 2CP-C) TaxID=290397 RepID=Q2IEN0_ANADE|nr:hypothetical protein Adeh_3270 [Anaeromyxobacter dehalogenans 2CP-C]
MEQMGTGEKERWECGDRGIEKENENGKERNQSTRGESAGMLWHLTVCDERRGREHRQCERHRLMLVSPGRFERKQRRAWGRRGP